MKKIKKAIKLFALVCLILLACFGIGMMGGVPIPFSNNRKQTPEVNIELVETNEEDSDVKEILSIR